MDLVGWSIIETSVYIITGCLPHLKPLVSHYTPAWLRGFLRTTITTLRTPGSSRKGAGSRYWSSRSGATTIKGGGRYPEPDGQPEDAIELTGPAEDLHRDNTNVLMMPGRPLSLESHPRISTEASVGETRAGGLAPVLSPGQIVVTKEVRMTRT